MIPTPRRAFGKIAIATKTAGEESPQRIMKTLKITNEPMTTQLRVVVSPTHKKMLTALAKGGNKSEILRRLIEAAYAEMAKQGD